MRFSRTRTLVLAWALVPVPVIGWIAAQSIPQRLSEQSTSTGAWVHMLGSSAFSAVLLVCAIINALIVTSRAPDEPRSLGRPYLVAQIILLAVAALWLLCIIAGDGWQVLEMGLAILVVAGLVVTFVIALRSDAESAARRVERRESRSPEAKRARRIARVAVPVAAVVALGAFILVQQTSVVVHRDCVVTGTFSPSDSVTLFTENCGDFTVASSVSDYDTLGDDDAEFSGTFDITSRGYTPGLPPQPTAIELVRLRD